MHCHAQEPSAPAATVPAGPPLLLRVTDVCEQLSLSRAAVQRLLTAGELPSVQIGRARRVRRADLELYINRLGTVPPMFDAGS